MMGVRLVIPLVELRWFRYVLARVSPSICMNMEWEMCGLKPAPVGDVNEHVAQVIGTFDVSVLLAYCTPQGMRDEVMDKVTFRAKAKMMGMSAECNDGVTSHCFFCTGFTEMHLYVKSLYFQ